MRILNASYFQHAEITRMLIFLWLSNVNVWQFMKQILEVCYEATLFLVALQKIFERKCIVEYCKHVHGDASIPVRMSQKAFPICYTTSACDARNIKQTLWRWCEYGHINNLICIGSCSKLSMTKIIFRAMFNTMCFGSKWCYFQHINLILYLHVYNSILRFFSNLFFYAFYRFLQLCIKKIYKIIIMLNNTNILLYTVYFFL